MAYTQIATISTDEHHTLQEFRASVGAPWTFLSDPGRVIQKDLDIAEYTQPERDPVLFTAMLWPAVGPVVARAGTRGVLRRVLAGGLHDPRNLPAALVEELYRCLEKPPEIARLIREAA